MEAAIPLGEVRIAVPQKYKDDVAGRQYRWFWCIIAGVLGGVNAAYYLLCIAFHWVWQFHLQADMALPVLGLAGYIVEVRRPWQYVVNDQLIKVFVVSPRSRLAKMEALEWTKTQVIGIEHAEWRDLPCLKLNILPKTQHEYVLVYGLSEVEEVRAVVIPLIEKYRRQYRQELWADKLRS